MQFTEINFLDKLSYIDFDFQIKTDIETSNKIVITKYGQWYFQNGFNQSDMFDCLIRLEANKINKENNK